MDAKAILYYLDKFTGSDEYNDYVLSWDYYKGQHDILHRKREAIGEGGSTTEVENLPNNQSVDNVFARIADQKSNYLFGKPVTITTENEQYDDALATVFNKKFHRTLTALGRESILCGISWLHPYYDDYGKLAFKKIPAYELCPIWMDSDHTQLGAGIRQYVTQVYEDGKEKEVTKVEVYTVEGVEKYILNGKDLLPDGTDPYASLQITYPEGRVETKMFSWGRVPLIPFKSSDMEIPLIRRAKSLQDGINLMLSDFQNNMQEDAGNSILVLKNYDGEDLGNFRANLSLYRTVKVRTTDGGDGGVESLQIEVNGQNYELVLKLLKRALIENMRGFDSKDDRLGGSPNEMNIQSAYSDMDLDANSMETEYQASFEDLMYFVNIYLANAKLYVVNDEQPEDVSVMFNRDMLTNASTIIENCKNSVGLISNRTIIENHPFTMDVTKEIEQMEAEKQQAMDEMNNYQFMTPQDEENGEFEQ